MEKVYIVRIAKNGHVINHEETSPTAAADALEFAIDMCGEQNVLLFERETSVKQLLPAAFLEYYSKRGRTP